MKNSHYASHFAMAKFVAVDFLPPDVTAPLVFDNDMVPLDPSSELDPHSEFDPSFRIRPQCLRIPASTLLLFGPAFLIRPEFLARPENILKRGLFFTRGGSWRHRGPALLCALFYPRPAAVCCDGVPGE